MDDANRIAMRRLMLAVALTAGGVAAAAADPEAVPTPRSSTAERAGIETPAGQLGYALGLRIGSRIAADFKEQHPDVDPAGLARGLAA